ncbi:DUF3054 domain-containing protein [Actinomadura hibisca]|uniref:DUF3054 domain-containing protein n=1 Tax=Actinomadura hibisca TaxID=68565 RepID=UPI0008355E00|nr:DUF3054 domain-containing protein [Actinomadura hibisca]
MRNAISLVLDVCGVLIFVAIGRASHAEPGDLAGIAQTAWPFLVGLAAGWTVTRAWRGRADALVPAGVGIWASTVVLGMALRVISGQGTAVAFVIVTFLFLALMLLGWRLVAWAVTARRRPHRASH